MAKNIYRDPGFLPRIYSIKELSDGTIIGAGRIYSHGTGTVGFIFKTNNNGDSLWCYDYLSSLGGFNELYDIVVNPTGGFTACGYVYPQLPDTGNQDCWFLQVDSVGCEISNCLVNTTKNLIESLPIRIFPNPAKDYFTIKSSENNILEVYLFDINGRLIIFKNDINAKEYTMFMEEITAGIYVLKVFDEKHSYVCKLIKE
jgi:hypothetical protein